MKKIAWLLPEFGEGSGGVRTILQTVEFFEKNNYRCDLYVGKDIDADATEIRNTIENGYGIEAHGEIFAGYKMGKKYDVAVATYYATAKEVTNLNCGCKMYFLQDYEPWFFPMSQNYLDAKESYSYGLKGITIGHWLSKKISDDFGMKSKSFDFCADLKTYKRIEGIEREKSICFVYQPFKPRRMAELGLKALQIVKAKCPDVKIYLYGSEKMDVHNLDVEHLGLVSPEECNELYNKCTVGLCLSATNPSRIPFEMMATGLPVVEVYGENTVYDFPDDGCLLAERTPDSIAEALIKVLEDKQTYNKLSSGGRKYMEKYPLERGLEDFKSILETYLSEKTKKSSGKVQKRYKKKPVACTGKMPNVGEDAYCTPIDTDTRSPLRRKISKIKYILKEG